MEIVNIGALPAGPLSGSPSTTTLTVVAKSVTNPRSVNVDYALPAGVQLTITNPHLSSVQVGVHNTFISHSPIFASTGTGPLPPVFNVMGTVTLNGVVQFTCAWAVHS
jgi:hypothetical protein